MPLVLACSMKLMVCLISSVFSGTLSAVSLMLSNSEQILEREEKQSGKWGDLNHKAADLVTSKVAYCLFSSLRLMIIFSRRTSA